MLEMRAMWVVNLDVGSQMAVFANESGRGFLFGQVRLGEEYRR